ncbi:Non-specific lipid-transfer protein 1 [Platanthera zijinensis]|uniref:Non-specific lipid-transfer protein n=1 Tax=Platanthera zijinensis TaxID=2320716 RepID=A0AAP0BCG7_9ASPA
MTNMIVVVAVALAMVLTILPMSTTALTCVDVEFDLLPCLTYIRSGGDVPSTCCSGLNNLVNAAKTTDDRRTACNCLKSLAQRASQDELDRAATLPDKCDISIPYKITPTIDCSK